MTLIQSLQTVLTRIGEEDRSIRTLLNGNVADLANLNTTAKENLVAAVNENQATGVANQNAITALQAALTTVDLTSLIDDSAVSQTTTYSSQQIVDAISEAISNLVDGADVALDTLSEIGTAINNNESVGAALTTAVANRLRFDAPQTLSAAQQLQALNNIGVGDPNTNFVATFEAALA